MQDGTEYICEKKMISIVGLSTWLPNINFKYFFNSSPLYQTTDFKTRLLKVYQLAKAA